MKRLPRPSAPSNSFQALATKQRLHLGVSVRAIAANIGIAPVTLHKALTNPQATVSATLAAAVAQDLSIDSVQAALVATRDELRAVAAGLDAPGGRPRAGARQLPGRKRTAAGSKMLKDRLDRAVAELEIALRWQSSGAYAAGNTQRRLAFRHHRIRWGCKREQVAAAMHAQRRNAGQELKLSQLEHELILWESERIGLDLPRIQEWLFALSAASGNLIGLAELDELGAALLELHLPRQTSETIAVRQTAPLHVETRDGALSVDRSALVFGAMNQEVLRYRGKGGAWIFNVRHPGYEHATVLTAATPVRLVLTRTPVELEGVFPKATIKTTPALEAALTTAGVISDVRVPRGESVAFASGQWHSVFLPGPHTSVLSLNHQSNLLLGRRYQAPPLAPDGDPRT